MHHGTCQVRRANLPYCFPRMYRGVDTEKCQDKKYIYQGSPGCSPLRPCPSLHPYVYVQIDSTVRKIALFQFKHIQQKPLNEDLFYFLRITIYLSSQYDYDPADCTLRWRVNSRRYALPFFYSRTNKAHLHVQREVGKNDIGAGAAESRGVWAGRRQHSRESHLLRLQLQL